MSDAERHQRALDLLLCRYHNIPLVNILERGVEWHCPVCGWSPVEVAEER